MNINFNLATPQAKVSSIRVIVTHKGKVYRKAIGMSCPVRDWSSTKQRSTHQDVNEQVRRVRLYLDSVLDGNSTPDDIRNALDLAPLSDKDRHKFVNEKAGRPSFEEVFLSIKGKTVAAVCRKVVAVMGKTGWEDVTPAWADVFASRMQGLGMSTNYIGRSLFLVKQVMSIGEKRKYHNNHEYSMISPTKEESYSVYLTKDEVDKLWNHEFKQPFLSKIRDIFIVGIYTASRYSDYSRLTMDNVHDGLLDFIQTKTGGRVIMPCSPRVIEVMKRNGGKVPHYSKPRMNEVLKIICREVGICDVLEIPKSKRKILGIGDGETVYKWMLVSTHTARRTGATLLYLAGVPTIQCMMITGHKTEESFMKYIKVTKEENARALMNCPFFK